MKKTIYVGQNLARALDGYPNASRRLEMLASRYAALVASACPALAEKEWRAICAACEQYDYPPADSPRVLLHLLEDADELEALGERWNVNIKQLRQRLKESGVTGMYAVLEVVQRFWQTRLLSPRGPKKDTVERLHFAGARVTP